MVAHNEAKKLFSVELFPIYKRLNTLKTFLTINVLSHDTLLSCISNATATLPVQIVLKYNDSIVTKRLTPFNIQSARVLGSAFKQRVDNKIGIIDTGPEFSNINQYY